MGVFGGGTGASGAAAVTSSHLGFDPRARAGLSDAAAAAAFAVSAELRGAHDAWAAGGALPRARALLRARGVPEAAVGARPPLTQTLTAFPPAAVVLSLGAATAWHAAPAGRAGVSWAWRAPAFEINVTLPSGVLGRVALPIAVLRAAVVAGGRGALRIAAARAGSSAPVVDGELRVAGPPAPSCAGLGNVGGESWAWCTAKGSSPPPRAVGWAEAEGEGRIRGGAPDGKDGALLWRIEGEGEWRWVVQP